MNLLQMIDENRNDFFSYLNKVASCENKLLVKGNLLDILEQLKLDDKNGNHSATEQIVKHITESVCIDNYIYFEFREKIGE